MMEILIKIVNEFLPILTAVGGGIFTLLFSKWRFRQQRNNFEVEELTALQQVIRDSSASLGQLSLKVMELEMLVTKLDQEKNELRRENNALKGSVERLEQLLTRNGEHPTIMEGGPTHPPDGGRTARKGRTASE